MARPPSANSILRNMKKVNRPEPKNPIGSDMFLPNHSGISTHPEMLTGFLKLNGSNANQTIDIGREDIETEGRIYLKSDYKGLNLGADGNIEIFGYDGGLQLYTGDNSDVLVANAFSSFTFSNGTAFVKMEGADLTTTGTVQAEHLYSTDDCVIDGDLSVKGECQLGDSNTDNHGINLAPDANTMLKGVYNRTGSGNYNSVYADLNISTTGGSSCVGNHFTLTQTGTDDEGENTDTYGAKYFVVNNMTVDHRRAEVDDYGIRCDTLFGGTIDEADSINVTGGWFVARGNISDADASSHTGFKCSATNTADVNYGCWCSATSATINWSYWNGGGDMYMGGDNAISKWGNTNTDMQMYSNGTRGVIDVATGLILGNATTNYTEIKADGEINLHGTAKVKKIATMDWYTGSMGSGNEQYIYGRDASDSVDEYMIWTVFVPLDMETGSDVIVKWRYCPTTTQTGGDQKVVRWATIYNSMGNSGVIGAYTGYTYQDITLTTDEPLRTIHETTQTISGLSAGDFLSFRLNRDADHANDTCVGDVFVPMNAFIEYTADKLGEAT